MKQYKFLLLMIVLLCFVNVSFAIDETEYIVSYPSNFLSTESRGPLIQPNYNLTLNYVTKHPSDGATRARIISIPGEVVLDACIFVGNDCTFDYNLTKDTQYVINTDNNGASYTGYYYQDVGGLFPFNSTEIYFVSGTYGYPSVTTNNNQKWTLLSLFTTEITPTLPQITFEYPYEEIDQIKQSNIVTVESTTPVTIFSGTFTTEVDIDSYISFVGNIQPRQIPVGIQNCYLELNNVLIPNSLITYTGATLNQHKSFYRLTNNFTTTQINNTIALLCYGSSKKDFNVLNGVIELHQLVDTTDYNYTIYSENATFSVNNLVGFDQVLNREINTTGFNLTNTNKSVYVIYDSNFEVSYGVTNTAQGYLTIDDIICPTLSRYGSIGSKGSSSYLCVKDITNQSSFNSSLYVKGDVDVNYQTHIKEVVLEDYEIGNNFINSYELNSLTYQNIDSQNITIDTADKDLLAIASLSISANEVGQEATFRFKIESENGSIMYRDVNNINEAGVSTNQYLFTELSATTYEVTLQGRINATTPNTSILNGSVLYMAVGQSDSTPNEFTITAQDTIFSNSVQSFTASDGIILSTTTGSINYPIQNGLINISFNSPYYFNNTVLNHNTTNNLQFNATPYPWINFTFTEYFSSNKISNFSLVCDDGYISGLAKTDYLLYQMNENVTSTSCTFTHPDYATAKFNVTDIVTSSLNTYTQNIYTTNSVLFNFKNALNESLINNFLEIYLFNLLDDSLNYNFNTSNGTAYIDLLSPSDYRGVVTGSSYSSAEFEITVTNRTTQNKTVYLYTNETSTQIFYTVLDDLGTALEGAKVAVLKYDTITSTWKTIQQCFTNSAGKCSLYLKSSEYYKYYIYYKDEQTPVLTTDFEFLDYVSRDPFIISLVGSTIDEYGIYSQATIIDFDYINNSNNTYMIWLEASFDNDVIDSVCLDVYYYTTTGATNTICTECLTDSGTVTCTKTFGNITYYAEAYSVVNNKRLTLERLTFPFGSGFDIFGTSGVLIVLLLTLTGIFFGLPDPVKAIFGAVSGLAFGLITGFLPLSYQVILTVIILGIIAVYKTRGQGAA